MYELQALDWIQEWDLPDGVIKAEDMAHRHFRQHLNPIHAPKFSKKVQELRIANRLFSKLAL